MSMFDLVPEKPSVSHNLIPPYLQKRKDGVKPVIELSYSSNKNLLTCPRRYQLLKRFLHPAYTWDTGLPAVGGTAIHSFLQARAIGASIEDATYEFFKSYDFVVEKEASDFNLATRAYEDCYATAVKIDHDLNLQAHEIASVEINGELRPAIEFKFNLIIKGKDLENDYHMRGAIDVVEYLTFGNRFKVGDFKTHRKWKETDESKPLDYVHKYDDQLIPYGFIVAALAKGLTKLPKNSIELLEFVPQFDTTYYSIFIDIDDAFVKPYTFTRDKQDVSDWLDKIIRLIYNIESYADRDIWPRTASGCEFYGKPCRFFKNCHVSDPETMQDLLLGSHAPAQSKPFNEWITLELEI